MTSRGLSKKGKDKLWKCNLNQIKSFENSVSLPGSSLISGRERRIVKKKHDPEYVFAFSPKNKRKLQNENEILSNRMNQESLKSEILIKNKSSLTKHQKVVDFNDTDSDEDSDNDISDNKGTNSPDEIGNTKKKKLAEDNDSITYIGQSNVDTQKGWNSVKKSKGTSTNFNTYSRQNLPKTDVIQDDIKAEEISNEELFSNSEAILKASSNMDDLDGMFEEEMLCSICCILTPISDNTIQCSELDCSNQAHKSCIKEDKFDWICSDCSLENQLKCAICLVLSPKKKLRICTDCHNAYHENCITNSSTDWDRWLCNICFYGVKQENTIEKSTEEIVVSDTYNDEQKEIYSSISNEDLKNIENVEKPSEFQNSCISSKINYSMYKLFKIDSKKVPNIRYWSTAKVHEYFKQKFNPVIAECFLKHDINGQTLLMMDRDIIVKHLGITNYGDALSVYLCILILKSRSTDLEKLLKCASRNSTRDNF